jgi:hypothetical protein
MSSSNAASTAYYETKMSSNLTSSTTTTAAAAADIELVGSPSTRNIEEEETQPLEEQLGEDDGVIDDSHPPTASATQPEWCCCDWLRFQNVNQARGFAFVSFFYGGGAGAGAGCFLLCILFCSMPCYESFSHSHPSNLLSFCRHRWHMVLSLLVMSFWGRRLSIWRPKRPGVSFPIWTLRYPIVQQESMGFIPRRLSLPYMPLHRWSLPSSCRLWEPSSILRRGDAPLE